MNASVILLAAIALFILAYRFYARHLAQRVFELDATAETPAHAKRDGVDYLPTNRFILLGHHYASITGAAPIVGPALAVIYGWLPALLWVVFGTIFMGAVADFSALVLSIRNHGRTLGDLVKDVIGGRGRLLFLFLGVCLFILLMAVFPIIIAKLLMGTPQSVIPSFALIPIAMLMGLMLYRANIPLVAVTIIGLVLMAGAMFLGVKYPIGQELGQDKWVAILLTYSFIASVVPVWLLLQPRDYLNSFWLYAGLALLVVCIFVASPTIKAPPLRTAPAGAENFPLFPFLFITIACGALSGVHSLFASATTSRQLNRETDAPMIGYGGMVLEGLLAVIAILVCTAGVASAATWNEMYANYGNVQGLAAFVGGSAMFLGSVGIPENVGRMLVSVTVIGFALTTLDSSARAVRFMFAELGGALKIPAATNRYIGSAICCAIAFSLATLKFSDKATGQILWPAFGVSNQVLACLALLIVSLFLYKWGKPIYYTAIPMAIMLVVTMYALVLNIGNWIETGKWPLVIVGFAVLICEVWLMIEGALALRRMAGAPEPQTESAAP